MVNLARYSQHRLHSCPSTAITKEKNNSYHLKHSIPSARGPKVPAHLQNKFSFSLGLPAEERPFSAQGKNIVCFRIVLSLAVPTALFISPPKRLVGLCLFIVNDLLFWSNMYTIHCIVND